MSRVTIGKVPSILRSALSGKQCEILEDADGFVSLRVIDCGRRFRLAKKDVGFLAVGGDEGKGEDVTMECPDEDLPLASLRKKMPRAEEAEGTEQDDEDLPLASLRKKEPTAEAAQEDFDWGVPQVDDSAAPAEPARFWHRDPFAEDFSVQPTEKGEEPREKVQPGGRRGRDDTLTDFYGTLLEEKPDSKMANKFFENLKKDDVEDEDAQEPDVIEKAAQENKKQPKEDGETDVGEKAAQDTSFSAYPSVPPGLEKDDLRAPASRSPAALPVVPAAPAATAVPVKLPGFTTADAPVGVWYPTSSLEIKDLKASRRNCPVMQVFSEERISFRAGEDLFRLSVRTKASPGTKHSELVRKEVEDCANLFKISIGNDSQKTQRLQRIANIKARTMVDRGAKGDEPGMAARLLAREMAKMTEDEAGGRIAGELTEILTARAARYSEGSYRDLPNCIVHLTLVDFKRLNLAITRLLRTTGVRFGVDALSGVEQDTSFVEFIYTGRIANVLSASFNSAYLLARAAEFAKSRFNSTLQGFIDAGINNLEKMHGAPSKEIVALAEEAKAEREAWMSVTMRKAHAQPRGRGYDYGLRGGRDHADPSAQLRIANR